MSGSRIHYLNQLIRMREESPVGLTKRANWLHFCHHCRADISTSPPKATLCTACNEAEIQQALRDLVAIGRVTVEYDDDGNARFSVVRARALGGGE